MKCPACGFETPEEQGHCDFCKEPFRRKAEPPRNAKAQPKVDIPPAVMAKLMEVRVEGKKSAGPPAVIPPEFAHLDAGERLPGASALLRFAAWTFLATVILIGVAASLVAVQRRKAAASKPARRDSAPLRAVPPAPSPPPAPVAE